MAAPKPAPRRRLVPLPPPTPTVEVVHTGSCSCCGDPAQIVDLALKVLLCLLCYGFGCDGKDECQR